ncbi:MAG: hypothetical protein AAFZ15_09745 [Bacteroidota bacterium]
MKVKPTVRRSRRWLYTSLLAFLFLSFNSLQAQDFVSSDVAKDRLETKSSELDDDYAQGNLSQMDYTLRIKFVASVLTDGIGNQRFTANAANSAKVNALYESMLQAAQDHLMSSHSQHASTINTIKEEMDALLRQ